MKDEKDAKDVSIQAILRLMVDKQASDLHIRAGSPPKVRLHGKLVPLKMSPLTPEDAKRLCYSVLTSAQCAKFEEERHLDLSLQMAGISRFRVNVFYQRGSVAAAFRQVPLAVPRFEDLGLPSIVRDLCDRNRGLVLVTGSTGSGKSTTLAAMIDVINAKRQEHIVTIEDPIEFFHTDQGCHVSQREIWSDVADYASALRHILRQDPDVVLIGEMRDLETIQAALQIAETGHLALSTLHTNSSIETINRIIDVFPPAQQTQVRVQLSFVLEAVISQVLIPRSNGTGRVLACEVMIANPAIRALIRENRLSQIVNQMQAGQSTHRMQTMNQSFASLYRERKVNLDDILSRSSDPNDLRRMIAEQ